MKSFQSSLKEIPNGESRVVSNLITKFEYDTLTKEELTAEEFEELKSIAEEKREFLKVENGVIRLTQHVGLVFLSSGKVIEILPKIYDGSTREDARRLLTIFFYEFLGLAKRASSTGGSLLSRKMGFDVSFLEILTLLILNYIEKKIIQPGIYRSYLRERLVSRSLNGKLLLSQTLLRYPFQKDRFVIEKEVLTGNVLANRIVAGLAESVAVRFGSSKIRDLAGKILLYLRSIGIESSRNMVEDLKRLRLNRMNEHYYPAIQFARFLFSNNKMTGSKGEPFTFLFDMNRLFEEFVASSLSGCLIQDREKIDGDFELKPDILCPVSNGAFVVIDTKWKFPKSKSARSGDEDGDVLRCDRFQVISYMYVLSERRKVKIPLGILLYPDFPGSGEKIWQLSEERKLLALGLGFRKLFRDRGFEGKDIDGQVRYLKRKVRKKLPLP